MSKYREIVSMVLDQIKAFSDDSEITEEHVVWLAGKYRTFLLKQRYQDELAKKTISTSNYQTICIDLEKTDKIDGFPCEGYYLRSSDKLPSMLSMGSRKIYPSGIPFGTEIAYISKDRMRYVGYNKWMKNIIYAAIDDENYLYLNSSNPQYSYLKQVQVSAIFEDAEEAASMSCDDNSSSSSSCDILDKDFPLEDALIPPMIELIVKELVGAVYRAEDEKNDADDSLTSEDSRKTGLTS